MRTCHLGPQPIRRMLVLWSILILGLLSEFNLSCGAEAPSPHLDGVTDLSGKERNPFTNPEHKTRATVLIFVSIDCPISNRYAPEIQRLQARFAKEGVTFWLVQPDTEVPVAKTREYLKEFGYSMELLRDSKRALVKLAGATVTPEAAVFAPGGKLVYRGRIDNRYVAFGKSRPVPTERDLEETLEALLAGKPIAKSSAPAIGCHIPQ